jgi:hypothetical protein
VTHAKREGRKVDSPRVPKGAVAVQIEACRHEARSMGLGAAARAMQPGMALIGSLRPTAKNSMMYTVIAGNALNECLHRSV